ncbi:hypothetical protein [Kingella kingae]|nr:hypothetical protein [Kingella kingae]MDK4573623.1 hypothetical protein [Kingella kingae]MDK4605741.1 hypothetical protein [Kingella kingae]
MAWHKSSFKVQAALLFPEQSSLHFQTYSELIQNTLKSSSSVID